MSYEVKSSINWLIVLMNILAGSLLMSISNLFGDFESFLKVWLMMMIILMIVHLWRMRSFNIVVEDAIYLKRILLPQHTIEFEDLEGIKLYELAKKGPFASEQSFIEIDTKDRYYTYYLHHFDIEEIKGLLDYLSSVCDVTYDAKSK